MTRRNRAHHDTRPVDVPALEAMYERHAAEIVVDEHRADCDAAYDDLIRAGWTEAEIMAGSQAESVARRHRGNSNDNDNDSATTGGQS